MGRSKTDVYCFLCDGHATAEDFCFGCKKIICADCSLNMDIAFDGHQPNDHLDDIGSEEYEDWD